MYGSVWLILLFNMNKNSKKQKHFLNKRLLIDWFISLIKKVLMYSLGYKD